MAAGELMLGRVGDRALIALACTLALLYKASALLY